MGDGLLKASLRNSFGNNGAILYTDFNGNYIIVPAQVVKNPHAGAGNIRDLGSIPGSGRPPGGGHGSPLQYSCLENPTTRGVWWATVHGVTKSRTRLR